MLVNKRKETSLYTAFLLTLITFILVLYSSFLTRSGVLGDTSVHSFTGDGMLPGLLFFLLFFIALSVMMMLPQRTQRQFYVIISFALLLIGGVARATGASDPAVRSTHHRAPGACLPHRLLDIRP
jgi:cytochrome c-type biogenesis protein CcmF